MKQRRVSPTVREDLDHTLASASELEVVTTCGLCSSSAVVPLMATEDRLHRLPGEFALVGCRGCGLIRLSLRPNVKTLSDYYPADDYGPYQPISELAVSAARDALRQGVLSWLDYPTARAPAWARIVAPSLPPSLARRATWGRENIPRWVPDGRALDLGCGAGTFLHRLKQLGWEVTGVDVSPTAVGVARSAYGLTVHLGQLEEAPLDESSFDFIHMSHVIEHVRDPIATLEAAARLLKPSGWLYIETPNAASVAFRWSKERWLHADTLRHLWLFSPTTLYRTLAKAGFRPDRQSTFGAPSYAWEATYREEERRGHLLSRRPGVALRWKPRVYTLKAASRIASLVRSDSGEIIGCWARHATTA